MYIYIYIEFVRANSVFRIYKIYIMFYLNHPVFQYSLATQKKFPFTKNISFKAICTQASFSSVFKNVFAPLIALTPCSHGPKENISNILNKLQLLS